MTIVVEYMLECSTQIPRLAPPTMYTAVYGATLAI